MSEGCPRTVRRERSDRRRPDPHRYRPPPPAALTGSDKLWRRAIDSSGLRDRRGLGVAVGGVGLTRRAVSGALFGAPFIGLGALLALIYLLCADPTAAIPGGSFVVTPTGIGAVMLVCGAAILLGLVVSVLALSTLRQHGRALTTQRLLRPQSPLTPDL